MTGICTNLDNLFIYINEIQLNDFIRYFCDTWVGRRLVNTRAAPRFGQSTWNKFDQAIQKENRTNNGAEGHHRGIMALLTVDHPGIWRFLRWMKVRRVDVGAWNE